MEETTADDVVRSHAMWAAGAGLMPVPLFDLIAVTAIQVDMLKSLARLYQADYSEASGKAFVTALTGTTLARLGASAVKALPLVGPVLGGVSMSALSAASTYAVGQVAIRSLEDGRGYLHVEVDLDEARAAYEQALERGKRLFANRRKPAQAENVLETLKELGKLRDQGVLSEEELQAKKSELLSRL